MQLPESDHTDNILRILVVDDEEMIREILADFLTLEGFSVTTAPDGISALERLNKESFNMIISDLKMPNMGGLELLDHVRADYENTLTIIMTGFGTVETAIEAMKRGAYDYILKPFKVEEMVHIIRRGIEKQRLVSENIRLQEIISLHKLSESLQATLSLDEVLHSTLKAALKIIGCDFASIHLKDSSTETIIPASHLVHTNAPPGVEDGTLNINKIVDEAENKCEILAHSPNADAYFLSAPKNLSTFMAAPLVARQKTIGLLAAYSCTPSAKFTEGQRKLINMLGSRAAAAIDNAKLHNGQQQIFRQTIQGLARAIEAMDKYTAGHSDRVTTYAKLIATHMGLPSSNVELITQSAMLHDIGKLGCHANLNKVGKLTEKEYEIFKQHPTYGKEILEPIAFLKPLIPGVFLHHERFDGQGYPQGLKGNEIPLVARILTIADAYDAMTSNRAYRKALKHNIAVAEILRCSKTHFDPEIVDHFLKGIEKHRKDCLQRGISVPD